MNKCREAFERRHCKSTLAMKRGGSVFAEDVPPGNYVDSGTQRRWEEWQQAWEDAIKEEVDEAIAYLFTCVSKNKSTVWASIDPTDHWPLDQWDTIKVQPLGILKEQEPLSDDQMKEALVLHGLTPVKISQLSDSFRNGVRYAERFHNIKSKE